MRRDEEAGDQTGTLPGIALLQYHTQDVSEFQEPALALTKIIVCAADMRAVLNAHQPAHEEERHCGGN